MNPNVFTDNLRILAGPGAPLIQGLDTTGPRPLTNYRRALPTPPGKMALDDWMKPRFDAITLILEIGLARILSNREMTPKELEGLMRFAELNASEICRVALMDFRKLVQSNRISGRVEELRPAARAPFVGELERFYGTTG
jgi:hypothetical protein